MLGYLEKTSDDFAYWRRHIGDSERTLARYSPSRNVSAVRAPILLMHGTEDERRAPAAVAPHGPGIEDGGQAVRTHRTARR